MNKTKTTTIARQRCYECGRFHIHHHPYTSVNDAVERAWISISMRLTICAASVPTGLMSGKRPDKIFTEAYSSHTIPIPHPISYPVCDMD